MLSQSEVITGAYYQSSGNPEGGTSLIIMPDNNFAILYFGGMRKGTWKRIENIYMFTFHTEPKFVLYGRYNPISKDTIKVHFSVDANLGYAVRFNDNIETPFIPIFNEDANCFKYPYTYTQKKALQQLTTYAPDLRSYYPGEIRKSFSQQYDFDIQESYNEFLLKGLPEEYSREGSFTAYFNDDDLLIERGGRMQKRSTYQEINEEDLFFIEKMTKNELFPKILDSSSEFFPYEENPSDTDLIPFIRIEGVVTTVKEANVSITPLFVVSCEE